MVFILESNGRKITGKKKKKKKENKKGKKKRKNKNKGLKLGF